MPIAVGTQACNNALARAERVIAADLARHLPAWRHSIPAAFANHDWDFSCFSRGERFVKEPLADGLIE